jgi:hypothetical protein
MPREWSAATVEPGGGKPTPAEWHAVSVPGRPDRFAGAERVAYRTTFADPRDPDEAMALLELRGLYAGADVWLNDDLVAESDAVFEPVRVPFVPEEDNELVVECRAPDDRYGGTHDTDRIPAEDSVPGIWWGVDVTTHPETFVVNVDVTPRVTGDGAAIDAAVEVYADAAVDDRITLTTRPAGERRGRGMMDRASVAAAAGEQTTVEHTIELRDPSLWWPREHGAQNRYEVRAKLDGAVETATTGLVTVSETDDGIAVNGEAVPVRGVTLQDGTVDDVERAVELNANLVRAHAHALSPAVYEACDEAGLLVWQDLPLTGPGIFDIGRGKELAGRLADAYGAHPSLAAFAVHDEPTDTFAERVGSGLFDRLRLRWRAWRSDYDHGAADEVAEGFPDDRPVYPVVGEPGTDPDAAALYPGWDYGSVDDLGRVCERYGLGDVVGEFGAASLTDAAADGDGDSGGSDGAPIADFDRAKHDAVVGSDDPAASQAYQAELVRGVAERLRTDGSPVVVANALRDTDAAGMGVFARNGEPKDAADELAAAFEPIQAFLVGASAGECDLVVGNDTPRNVSGTVAWEAGEETGSAEFTVGATGRATVETVSIPQDADSVDLEVRTAERSVTNSYRL